MYIIFNSPKVFWRRYHYTPYIIEQSEHQRIWVVTTFIELVRNRLNSNSGALCPTLCSLYYIISWPGSNPSGPGRSRRVWHTSDSFARVIFRDWFVHSDWPESLFGGQFGSSWKKLNIKLLYDSTIPPLVICSRELRTDPHWMCPYW